MDNCANIPQKLFYSYSIIRLDASIPEKDFCYGLESFVPVLKFKRIQSRQNENTLADTKLIELKFLSSKFPNAIAIYKVIYKVSPSTVICRNCLRYCHKAKFRKGKASFSFCGSQDHI